ncbi:BQ5605_C009g05685 [Microbotryum silenes-dioicae]|uniref:endo-polygalacturonase n=1 Tax=Microbotryum silenes-dioicae TaxID=796604 RepID=A0A2X0P995_9BASI|nr:BQ5605_C009g05685 [Microbotryum silenes-dioicae]
MPSQVSARPLFRSCSPSHISSASPPPSPLSNSHYRRSFPLRRQPPFSVKMLMHGPNVLGMVALASLLLPTVVFADQPVCQNCLGVIREESDVVNAIRCKEVHLGGFTVTSRKTLGLELCPGATVDMTGDITFDNYKEQNGHMMYIKGQNITFMGNKHKILANGQKYWPQSLAIHFRPVLYDVPTPVLGLMCSGSVQDLSVINSPRQAIFIGNLGRLIVRNVNVDNSAGQGRAVNTDGMDVKAQAPLEITGCTITSQDDCIAISEGSAINVHNNTCHGGHGISIGSVRSYGKVTNVSIAFNHLDKTVNALRVKTMKDAKNATVDGITYESNVVGRALRCCGLINVILKIYRLLVMQGTDIQRFGVILQQNYTNDGSQGQPPTSGVVINNVRFVGNNQFTLTQNAISIMTVFGQQCPTTPMHLETIKFIGGRGAHTYGVIPTAMQAELSLIQNVKPQVKSTPVFDQATGQATGQPGSQQTKPSGGTQSGGIKKTGQSGSHSSSSSHQHSVASASSPKHRHHGPGHSSSSGAPSLAAVSQHQGIKRPHKVNHHYRRKHHRSHPSHRK